MTSGKNILSRLLLTAAIGISLIFVGCTNKETLLDVDTPSGGVQVQQDKSDGSVTIDVDE